MRLRPGILLILLLIYGTQCISQELLVPAVCSSDAILQVKSDSPLQLPFFDDFSKTNGTPDQTRWSGSQAFANYGYGPLPPTVGVLTLDALNEEGILYANLTEPFSADTLTSQVVRLDSVVEPIPCALSAADSLYLSFYYLPGGSYGPYHGRIGDMPEVGDSLVVEFYNANDGRWYKVWGIGGIDPDTLNARTGNYWQYVMIPIVAADYFNGSFRFRFRNVCSLDASTTPGLIANSDQWHIDCVSLDRNRSIGDKYDRDIAFVNPAPSLLKDYCAMPARQYRSSDMASTIGLTIANRYSSPVASHYSFSVYDSEGADVYDYDGGFENVPPYPESHEYQQSSYHARPSVSFAYPEGTRGTYRVVHVVKEGVAGDNYPDNDTVVFTQVFDDYYAYDDGTAENGYGLTSTSSNVFLACAYNLHEPDTLLGVRLYFNRTREGQNSTMGFRMAVWNDNGGRPGTLIYLDEQIRFPQFGGLNIYCTYPLERALPVSGRIYVGFQQENNDYINIGFDRNNNHNDRIFYRIGSEWQHCSFAGSMMLRPYFSVPASLGISATKVPQAELYPNPAHEGFYVSGIGEGQTIEVLDRMGRRIYNGIGPAYVNTDGWTAGIYLVVIRDKEQGQLTTKKITKR
ncbi:MAG: T9SS type A sorting domain-containing protein [Bacteroidales bacterium]|nr:T9SS type A sorting domain-containing protein [Bacteroidales bacterium]